jgi:hypothetical protein
MHDEPMTSGAVIERMERVVAIRCAVSAGQAVVDDLRAGLVDIRNVRAFLDATEASIVSTLKPAVSFPESDIAEASRGSLGGASKTVERAATLEAAPRLAGALDEAAVTAGHIDALTHVGKGLDADQREELVERADALVDVAAAATVEQFARRLRDERKRLLAKAGVDRLEQQQQATSMRSWVDGEGMWNVRGRFDPVLGVKLAASLDTSIESLFSEQVPEFCPTDPVAKQEFLRAHAFARLVGGEASSTRSGRPEFVVVIDAGQSDPAGGPTVDWPIAVEIPPRVLAEMIGVSGAQPVGVVVRNGVVIHAPGEVNLGRTTRLANRAQRRALRGLYSTCGVPGCAVHYDRCKLHHVVWWRNGGRTDLDNLLPLCSVHHHAVHGAGWELSLDSHRALMIRFPDGSIQTTGPPSRRAA